MRTRWAELEFGDARTALLVFVVLLAIALLFLLVSFMRSGSLRGKIGLPAVLPVMRGSPLSLVRHVPLMLFLAGVPFFAIALADPLTGFAREEVSYPGRRIALLVDGSTSMVIRFGNFAYVVTPFTNDYENVLLSTRLVGDPAEWGRFPDWGTTIIEGIDQATQLFRTFNFTNASGNLMIVFTDGRDSQLSQQKVDLERVVAEARRWKIPVYMLRTAYNRREGEILQDKIWKSTVEQTGGRFYAAYDDESIARALREIDRLSPGRIETREYSVRRPRFAGWVLVAVGLWLTAALLKLNFG